MHRLSSLKSMDKNLEFKYIISQDNKKEPRCGSFFYD
jgi:hypothetical protein